MLKWLKRRKCKHRHIQAIVSGFDICVICYDCSKYLGDTDAARDEYGLIVVEGGVVPSITEITYGAKT